MAITLDDVVLEQMQTNETLVSLKDNFILNFQMENQFFSTLITQFDEFIGLLKDQMRISDEQRRESKGLPPSPPIVDSPEGSPDQVPKQGSGGIPLGIVGIAALGAIAIGTIKGFIDKNAKIFAKITERIKKVGTTIRSWFTAFGDKLGGLGRRIGRIFNIGEDATKLGEQIKKFFSPVRSFFTNLKNNPLVKFAGTLGRILGRLLAPITLAIDLFRGISGEFEELEPDATMGDKVKAFAEGFLKGLTSFLLFPVELLKDVLSFLIGLIPGTEWITDFLDSFDIVEKMQEFIDFIFDGFNGIVDEILDFGSKLNPMNYFGGDDDDETPKRLSGTSRRARRMISDELSSETLANVGNSQAAPIIIQDNSVKSSNQNNVSNQMGNMPMASPVNDNRTRASAYATG